jgi:hypothetical protein
MHLVNSPNFHLYSDDFFKNNIFEIKLNSYLEDQIYFNSYKQKLNYLLYKIFALIVFKSHNYEKMN